MITQLIDGMKRVCVQKRKSLLFSLFCKKENASMIEFRRDDRMWLKALHQASDI